MWWSARGKPLRLAFRAREGWWPVNRGKPSVSCFERGRGGGGVLTEGIPLRLAFQAREGWWWCVDRGNPSVSHFMRERDVVVGERETPLSRISSEGGVVVVCRQKEYPSISHFEQGRSGGVSTEGIPLCLAFRAREGWWWCVDRGNTPLSRISSKGGVVVVCQQKEYPSISHFKQGRGGGGVLTEGIPLCLAFQAREGWWWCVDRRNTPPSRVSSEGGVVVVC
jgi:hypothetical protein